MSFYLRKIMDIKNKKILLIGGNGFIGSHLADKFLELGANITILSRSGVNKNTKHLVNKVKFVKVDIRNIDDLRNNIDADLVVYLAGFTNIKESFNDPLKDFDVSRGIVNVLQAMKERNVKYLIYF